MPSDGLLLDDSPIACEWVLDLSMDTLVVLKGDACIRSDSVSSA